MRELSAAPELALDTEGDSLHHYPERLALIQIGVPDGAVWLVDPLALAPEQYDHILRGQILLTIVRGRVVYDRRAGGVVRAD